MERTPLGETEIPVCEVHYLLLLGHKLGIPLHNQRRLFQWLHQLDSLGLELCVNG